MSARGVCGHELKSAAALARGVCDDCRNPRKRPQRRRKVEPAPTEPMFDVEPQPRRLVELPGWPDYRREGLI